MSQPWAIRIARADIDTIGPLRQTAGIRVGNDGEHVWLRGDVLEEPLEQALRCLPGAERFLVLADGQLQAVGMRVPQGRLPEIAWTPLSEWLLPRLPPSALAGRVTQRMEMKLVRCADEQQASLLVVSREAWCEYATHCPQVRLDRWSFAASADGRVLVRGQPLPPLPGECYTLNHGIAVPAGWRFDPLVDAATLRPLLGLGGQDFALVHEDGSWERIEAEEMVRASRSAVRGTFP